MIGFIGGGKMAEALIKGILSRGHMDVFVAERDDARRTYLENEYKITTTADNKKIIERCSLVILAIKPQDMVELLDEISGFVKEDTIVISVAAGFTINFLKKKLNHKKLVRVMPNIPAVIQEGMSIISLNDGLLPSDIKLVEDIFSSIGKVITLAEDQMNAMTTLSSCSPAFIALFVESLIDVGIKMGLDEASTKIAAIQMLLGTAKLLHAGLSPADLRKMVASPGGMTIAGLDVFAKEKLPAIVASALVRAQKRGDELGQKE